MCEGLWNPMNHPHLVLLRSFSLFVHAIFLYEGLTTDPGGHVFGLVDRFLCGVVVGATAITAIVVASILFYCDRNRIWRPVHLLCLGLDAVMLVPMTFPLFLPDRADSIF